MFPPEAVIDAKQMTPQALFHMPPGALVNKFVVAGERSRLENDDTAEATRGLREMLSSQKLSKLMAELKMWIKCPDFAAKSDEAAVPAFKAWMATIVINSARDVARQANRRANGKVGWIDRGLALPLDRNHMERTEDDEQIIRMMSLLHQFTADEQKVIRLHFLVGMTQVAIAKHLHQDRGWVQRVLAKVKTDLVHRLMGP